MCIHFLLKSKIKALTAPYFADKSKQKGKEFMNEKSLNVLKELEKTSTDFWNIAPETANFLNMLIKISNSKNAVEVGTSNGYSGVWLAKALKVTGGKLTTIEYYEKRIALALENFKKCEVDEIKKRRNHSRRQHNVPPRQSGNFCRKN